MTVVFNAADLASSDQSPGKVAALAGLLALFTLFCSFHAVHKRIIGTGGSGEARFAALLGLCAGGACQAFFAAIGQPAPSLRFDADLFFTYLLPPVVFEAGFAMKKRHFFENSGSIICLGVVGTIVSFGAVSAVAALTLPHSIPGLDLSDCFQLGAILAATDSIAVLGVLSQDRTPSLFALAFGESVMNDATALVLLAAVQQRYMIGRPGEPAAVSIPMGVGLLSGYFIWQFLGSLAIGTGLGLLCAMLLRRLTAFPEWRACAERQGDPLLLIDSAYVFDKFVKIAVSLLGLFGFLSYLIATEARVSGVVAIFASGVILSHYGWHSLSSPAKVSSTHMLRTVSYLSETFIMISTGLCASHAEFLGSGPAAARNTMVVVALVLAYVIIGRAAAIIPFGIVHRAAGGGLTTSELAVLGWAGLVRGAVSVAMTLHAFPTDTASGAIIQRGIVLAVLISLLVIGSLSTPLFKILLPDALAGATEATCKGGLIAQLGPDEGSTSADLDAAAAAVRSAAVCARTLRVQVGNRVPALAIGIEPGAFRSYTPAAPPVPPPPSSPPHPPPGRARREGVKPRAWWAAGRGTGPLGPHPPLSSPLPSPAAGRGAHGPPGLLQESLLAETEEADTGEPPSPYTRHSGDRPLHRSASSDAADLLLGKPPGEPQTSERVGREDQDDSGGRGLMQAWRQFDRRCMQPLFGGRHAVALWGSATEVLEPLGSIREAEEPAAEHDYQNEREPLLTSEP